MARNCCPHCHHKIQHSHNTEPTDFIVCHTCAAILLVQDDMSTKLATILDPEDDNVAEMLIKQQLAIRQAYKARYRK